MNIIPPADVISGAVILGTVVAGLIISMVIVVVEGVALRLLRWAGLWRSLADSVIANVASAVVGLAAAILVPAFLAAIAEATALPLLLGSFLLSTVIEAGAIALIRRRPLREALGPFAAANAASHVLILALILTAGSAGSA